MSHCKLMASTALALALGLGASILNAGSVYWIDSAHLEIQRANLDGSNAEAVLAAGLASPSGIALDAASGKVYWTDYQLGKIERANLDGTDVELLANSILPTGLALDRVGGKMDWTSM